MPALCQLFSIISDSFSYFRINKERGWDAGGFEFELPAARRTEYGAVLILWPPAPPSHPLSFFLPFSLFFGCFEQGGNGLDLVIVNRCFLVFINLKNLATHKTKIDNN